MWKLEGKSGLWPTDQVSNRDYINLSDDLMIELTVPWGKDMEAAFKRKKDKYSEPTAERREAGRSTSPYPVEVGCQGFPGTSPPAPPE